VRFWIIAISCTWQEKGRKSIQKIIERRRKRHAEDEVREKMGDGLKILDRMKIIAEQGIEMGKISASKEERRVDAIPSQGDERNIFKMREASVAFCA
jgi:hypothetical protein